MSSVKIIYNDEDVHKDTSTAQPNQKDCDNISFIENVHTDTSIATSEQNECDEGEMSSVNSIHINENIQNITVSNIPIKKECHIDNASIDKCVHTLVVTTTPDVKECDEKKRSYLKNNSYTHRCTDSNTETTTPNTKKSDIVETKKSSDKNLKSKKVTTLPNEIAWRVITIKTENKSQL